MEKDPDDSAALGVVRNFNAFLTSGKNPVCIEEFLLPVPYTAERLAEKAKTRAAHLAYLAAQKNSSGEQRA